MTNKLGNDSQGKMDAPPAKRTYAKPECRECGKVRSLTDGSATVGTDSGGTMNKSKQSDRGTRENCDGNGEHPRGNGRKR